MTSPTANPTLTNVPFSIMSLKARIPPARAAHKSCWKNQDCNVNGTTVRPIRFQHTASELTPVSPIQILGSPFTRRWRQPLPSTVESRGREWGVPGIVGVTEAVEMLPIFFMRRVCERLSCPVNV